MHFAHRRTLRKGHTLALLFNVVGLFLFAGMATYLVFFQEKTSAVWFGKTVFVILAITLPLVIFWFVRLFRGNGEWNIQLSEKELIWQVPDNIGEKNFRVPIANISKIICESGSNSETSDWHYIETVSGERYHLNPSASGVSLNKLCNRLDRIGVKYETRHLP